MEVERRHYQDTLRTVTQQKVLDKTSEKLSDNLVGIAVDNYEVHKLEREVAHSVLKIKSQLLALIDPNQLDVEEIVEILKKIDGCDTNYWSLILSRSTAGISNSTGLSNFVNVNAAFKRIEQEGFVIIDPASKSQNQENE
ncbi:MAG: hypothetical protein HC907_36695 [Richelia sp. SM1_7_0]|nr:hypothetical protein [Richelia sp. SM1_7_0]